MSTAPTETPRRPALQIGHVDLKELAAILIRREGLREGLFEVSVQFNLEVANFQTPAGGVGPGVLSMVGGVALTPASRATLISVDAAEVNPAPAARLPRKVAAAKGGKK
jgi:hypothetical protein